MFPPRKPLEGDQDPCDLAFQGVRLKTEEEAQQHLARVQRALAKRRARQQQAEACS